MQTLKVKEINPEAAARSLDVQDSEFKNRLEQLEAQAQDELEELHTELLEMRRTCHKLEVALNESEAKRCARLILLGRYCDLTCTLKLSLRCSFTWQVTEVMLNTHGFHMFIFRHRRVVTHPD